MTSREVATGIFIEDRGYGVVTPLARKVGRPALVAVVSEETSETPVVSEEVMTSTGAVGDEDWEHHVAPLSLFY